MKAEKRLQRGLAAYADLRRAFDPNGVAVSELESSGVTPATIDSLYPFDFKAYAPALKALFEDFDVAESFVKDSLGWRVLNMDELLLSGLNIGSLDALYEQFLRTEYFDEIFKVLMVGFTHDMTRFPIPNPSTKRSPAETANSEVNLALTSLTLVAWALANWRELHLHAEAVQREAAGGRGTSYPFNAENALDSVLRIHEHVLTPLIESQQRAAQS